jgi:predicted aconitase
MRKDAWSCVCYAPEIGNVPKLGDNLSWSESSAINYANSAIGARTNRNSMGIDTLTAFLGKAPYFGLMTDEGRKATWLIEVKDMPRMPLAEMLGSAIGLKVTGDVPYIVGMDGFVNALPNKMGYLKDMGAATASNGAVGLYHMDGVTPEAIEQGRDLLKPGYQTYVIDWKELQRVYAAYPNLWPEAKKNATPERVFIGCPVNTREQLEYWGSTLVNSLEKYGKSKLTVPTTLFAHTLVAENFRKMNANLAKRMEAGGIDIALDSCPMMWLSTPFKTPPMVATNSNKTRAYSTARYFPDSELTHIAVTGKIPTEITGGIIPS